MKIDLKTLAAVISVLMAVGSILGAVRSYWAEQTAHAIQEEHLRRELHQMRQIIVEQFPAYTAAFEWEDDK